MNLKQKTKLSGKSQSGHAGFMFVAVFPALFGMYIWAIDGAHMLQSDARLTDAMEVASLVIAAEDIGKQSEVTAQRFISSYFPDVPLQDIQVTVSSGKEVDQENTLYSLNVEIKRDTLFNSPGGYDSSFTLNRNSSSSKGVTQQPIDLVLVADYSGSMYSGGKYERLQSTIVDIANSIKSSNEERNDESTKSRIGLVGYDMYTAQLDKDGNKSFRSNIYCTEQFGVNENCQYNGLFFRELVEPLIKVTGNKTPYDEHLQGDGAINIATSNHNNRTYNKWSPTEPLYRFPIDYPAIEVCKKGNNKKGNNKNCSDSWEPYLQMMDDVESSYKKIDIDKTINNIFIQETAPLLASDTKNTAVYHNIDLTKNIDKSFNEIVVNFEAKNPRLGEYLYHVGEKGKNKGKDLGENACKGKNPKKNDNLCKERYYSGTAFYSGLISAAQMLDSQSTAPRQMIVILSDGQDTYLNLANALIEKGLCTKIKSHLNSKVVEFLGREVSVEFDLAVIGFNYDVDNYPQINNCAGAENVYKADDISDIKDQVLTLMSEEIGTLVR